MKKNEWKCLINCKQFPSINFSYFHFSVFLINVCCLYKITEIKLFYVEQKCSQGNSLFNVCFTKMFVWIRCNSSCMQERICFSSYFQNNSFEIFTQIGLAFIDTYQWTFSRNWSTGMFKLSTNYMSSKYKL